LLKAWSVSSVYELIIRIRDETFSHRLNTHAQWHCKQDLYRIKWAAEQALAQCEKFQNEDEFVKSYEHNKLIKAIQGGNEER
jgi:hypothetical protein